MSAINEKLIAMQTPLRLMREQQHSRAQMLAEIIVPLYRQSFAEVKHDHVFVPYLLPENDRAQIIFGHADEKSRGAVQVALEIDPADKLVLWTEGEPHKLDLPLPDNTVPASFKQQLARVSVWLLLLRDDFNGSRPPTTIAAYLARRAMIRSITDLPWPVPITMRMLANHYVSQLDGVPTIGITTNQTCENAKKTAALMRRTSKANPPAQHQGPAPK